jgi:hypothetical protein
MLRRTKANIELDVPPKETLTVFVPLTELQRFWTYRLLTRMDTMELKKIFTDEINPEDGNANQGRREVLSHLENQMQNVNTGRAEVHRACFAWRGILVADLACYETVWKRLMNLLIQLRRVCDQLVTYSASCLTVSQQAQPVSSSRRRAFPIYYRRAYRCRILKIGSHRQTACGYPAKRRKSPHLFGKLNVICFWLNAFNMFIAMDRVYLTPFKPCYVSSSQIRCPTECLTFWRTSWHYAPSHTRGWTDRHHDRVVRWISNLYVHNYGFQCGNEFLNGLLSFSKIILVSPLDL